MVGKIAFVVWPEAGHLHAVARLGRELRERGHATVALGYADFGPAFERAGFDFQPVGHDAFPPGSLDHALGLLRRPVIERYLAHSASGFLDGGSWDLVLVDALMPVVALAALGRGLRVGMFHTNFPYTRRPGLPPLTSGIVPGGLRAAAATELAWRITLAGRVAARLLARRAGRPGPLPHLRAMARQQGLPPGFVRTDTPLGYGLELPSLVLCPWELELPHARPPSTIYGEASIDTVRTPRAMHWERLVGAEKVVVVALGTQTDRYGIRVVEAVLGGAVESAARHPGWRVVLATGTFDEARLGPLPSNVLAQREIPQLELLARADVMVTHGGLNSVKEAVSNGVPMVVTPMVNDQPGNGARVVYHGLGVVLDPRRASRRSIADAIEGTATSSATRARVRTMAERFRAVQDARPSLAFVERLLARPPGG